MLPEPGLRVRIFTYLHHKEDVLKLFGFHSADERSLFLELIKVDGIGPKQAVKILSGASSQNLINALETGNVDYLSTIPGIGKKTAQKMILSLKNILTSADDIRQPGPNEHLVEALCAMGYDRKNASKALDKALEELSVTKLSGQKLEDEAFKKAIISLST
jgi:Holliday junction DNA helicase RuvA